MPKSSIQRRLIAAVVISQLLLAVGLAFVAVYFTRRQLREAFDGQLHGRAMTIAALWHGPAWTFVAWGVSHGIALAAHQVWKQRKMAMPDWLGWLLTLLFITSSIVFLRAADMPDARHMLASLLPHANLFGLSALHDVLPVTPTILLRPVTAGAILAFLFKSSMEYSKAFRPNFRTAVATAVLFLISIFFMNSAPARQFVYFAY